ncbi:MAG TPA: tryptophan synthase subunit alpha [Candidatus Sulfotelmatobacter sp.]|jgi:tryptophan synthase alpha chain|nr:tryptophan synthase subunit alpha [Candidatus Sulfotelmatobacter sp.]
MAAIASPDRRLARSLSHKPGLVVYVTCGDPNIATTREIVLAACRAGADVIELGVPFSDPVADGPVIQRASERALQQGTSLADVLRLAREVRQQSDAGLIIFSYLNPVLRFGLECFCAESAKAGVDGALIIDLTVEEAGEYRRLMAAHDLDTIFLAAPTSPDKRLKAIAEACCGFVYAVSRTGITGAQKQLASDAQDLVKRIRKFTRLPVAVGFGISTAEQFAEVGGFADAAVVGSAIVQAVEQNPGREAQAVAELIGKMRVGSRSSAGSGR